MAAQTTSDPTTGAPSTPTFLTIDGAAIDDDTLKQCAARFTAHYGIWASTAPAPLKPGTRVRMSAAKLREKCLESPAASALALVQLDGVPVGHALATKWPYKDGYVGWVTQLVVHTDHRRRRLATGLIESLRASAWGRDLVAAGLASTHPAACKALASAFAAGPVDLQYIADNARAVLARSPVGYVRDAPLGGALASPPAGASYLVDTAFHVDHAEPQGVLDSCVQAGSWRLGALQDGHEFLILVPAVPPA